MMYQVKCSKRAWIGSAKYTPSENLRLGISNSEIQLTFVAGAARCKTSRTNMNEPNIGPMDMSPLEQPEESKKTAVCEKKITLFS